MTEVHALASHVATFDEGLATVLTQDRLHELLDYDRETGAFRWRVRRNGNTPAGLVAGHWNRTYRIIVIDRKRYFAHRLAWLYVNGQWPDEEVDHINRDGGDNRIANLRLATGSENSANRGPLSTNKSGVKGVYWNAQCSRWHASITIGGQQRHLGVFREISSAAAAYDRAAKELFGEFAYVNGDKT